MLKEKISRPFFFTCLLILPAVGTWNNIFFFYLATWQHLVSKQISFKQTVNVIFGIHTIPSHWIVSVILRDPPLKAGHARFTIALFKTLYLIDYVEDIIVLVDNV